MKIRGFRVELAEIEAVLLEQPHVSSAIAHLHEENGAQILAAYVVLNDPAAVLDRAAMLAALRARLPAYMVPSFLDVVVEMPLLPSGKVDRKSLPPPNTALVDTASADIPPASVMEETIAGVWTTIFNVPVIGVEQNFFLDLGGHSLLAARVAALLHNRTGIDVAVRDVYAFPTVRELAHHIERVRPAPPT